MIDKLLAAAQSVVVDATQAIDGFDAARRFAVTSIYSLSLLFFCLIGWRCFLARVRCQVSCATGIGTPK